MLSEHCSLPWARPTSWGRPTHGRIPWWIHYPSPVDIISQAGRLGKGFLVLPPFWRCNNLPIITIMEPWVPSWGSSHQRQLFFLSRFWCLLIARQLSACILPSLLYLSSAAILHTCWSPKYRQGSVDVSMKKQGKNEGKLAPSQCLSVGGGK